MQAHHPIQTTAEDDAPSEPAVSFAVPFATTNVIGLFVPTSMPRPAVSPTSAPS